MDILTGLLTKAGFGIAKYGWEQLNKQESAAKAISLTSKHFNEKNIEVAPALERWCKSDEFKIIVERIAGSDTTLSDSDITQSFITIGDLYLEEVSSKQEEIARDILAYFAEEYRKLELTSTQAPLYLSNQAKTYEQNRVADQNSVMAMLQDIQSRGVLADETRVEEIADERILNSKIEQIKDLIKSKRYLYAQELLLNLKKEFNGKETKDQRFKVINSLGVCALHLNDTISACEIFDEALLIEPNCEIALSNAAMAAFINNDTQTALDISQKARIISPKHPAATTIYIQSLRVLGKMDELDNLIENEKWLFEESSCLVALGAISYLNANYEKAEEFLKLSIELDDTEPQTYELLSISIFHPIIRDMQNDPPLPWKISDETICRIKEAERFVSKAIALLEKTDDKNLLIKTLTNRAQIRSVLGDIDGALKDTEKVLVENEFFDLALNTKGITLLKKGKQKEAIEYLEKVSDPYIKEGGIVELAKAYIDDGNISKGLELLEDVWDPNSTERRMLYICEALILAYSKLTKYPSEKAEKLLEYLENKFNNTAEGLIAQSNLFYVEKKANQAKLALLLAYKTATNNQKDYINLALAGHAFDHQIWDEAVNYFSLVVNTKTPLIYKQNYAVSLLNGGRMQEALDYSRTERNGGKPLPIISEVEARVLEHIDDLPKALELRLKLHGTIYDTNEENLIKGFMLALRQGKEDIAKDTILKVDFAKIENNAWALSNVAQAYAIVGIEGAIPLAYKALQLGFENPDFHLAYLRVFLSRENPEGEMFRPTEVRNDCTVELLLSTGKKLTYLVTDNEPADKQKGRISLNDPVALKLLGKKTGETVALKESSFEKLSAEIIEVKSKYVYAFQETLTNFSSWFPDNRNLGLMDISNNDFSLLFSQLDKRYAHVRYVMQLHNEKRLPLSVTAHLISKSRIDTWIGMISENEGHVFASLPIGEDLKGTISANRVVIDLIAILSLDYLNILDKLDEVFDEIYIPQSVLDEINQEFLEERISSPNRGTLGSKSGSFFSYELTDRDIQNRIAFLNKLKDFITSKTTIVPVSGALMINKEKFLELSKVLGDAALDSILVAKEKEALLFADDLAIYEIAKRDWNVNSVWSQILLLNLRNRNLITEDDYHENIYKLVIANYEFLTYQLEDIVWAIKENDWKVTAKLERFMRLLKGPYCNEDWAIEAGAELIKLSTLNISQDYSRITFIDFLIKTLLEGRNRFIVLEKLKIKIKVKFNLLQAQLPQILHTIQLWKIK
jgi:uncharacterized protein HemY